MLVIPGSIEEGCSCLTLITTKTANHTFGQNHAMLQANNQEQTCKSIIHNTKGNYNYHTNKQSHCFIILSWVVAISTEPSQKLEDIYLFSGPTSRNFAVTTRALMQLVMEGASNIITTGSTKQQNHIMAGVTPHDNVSCVVSPPTCFLHF